MRETSYYTLRPECITKMGYPGLFAVNNANNVKSKQLFRYLGPAGILKCGTNHLSPFFRGDSYIRWTEIFTRPRLYFDDHKRLSISCNHVQFTVSPARLVIARHYHVPE